MASIFKNSSINDKLEKFEIPDFKEKIAIIKTWHKDYHKGTLKQDKETSREQAYNQDIFIKILGYEEKPNNPYSLIPKDTTEKGQLPDVTLGYFTDDNKNISAVVELKGTSIPLDKPQKREGNMSPIQQAFKYKTQHKKCPFVIASNFYEFRLFQDNQLDFEMWTLDDLVNGKNNYFQFRKFYYLLSKQHFTALEGKTVTQELLSDIRIEQEDITNKFYKEYKKLRLELLRNLYLKNEKVRKNIEVGIEKAQKIIDRIVFVCFCEDDGLLPDNSLARVLKYSENSYGSLWNVLKGFFESIDQGSEKLEIPNGYNGGLFRNDEILNDLTIDDEVLKNFVNISKYNFNEDLSVTILGHIFEQSISDLEEIKDKVKESNNIESIDKISKRKKDGIFYTPDYIVEYIVQNSLGKYLFDKEEELKTKHRLKEDIQDQTYEKREQIAYKEYQVWLKNIKVLDPACGSGAFLVKVFDYLLEENKRVGQILGGSLFDNEMFYKEILKNNIFGVDLNSESVEITRLSLWLKTAQKNKKLTALDENIKCGNSLIDDPNIAENKSFNWNKEFPEIMKIGGFDVIVGNPPYTYRNAISDEEKKYFIKNYDSTEGNFDLYKFFIERLLKLTKDSGYNSFIVPNTFLSAKTYGKLRNLILKNFEVKELVDLGLKVFEGVVVESVIFIFIKSKKPNNKNCFIKVLRDRTKQIGEWEKEYTVELSKKKTEDNIFNINISNDILPIMNKITEHSKPLDDACYCTVGINTGYIKNELTSERKINDRYHKMLNGKDISRHKILWKGEWIMYDPDFVKSKGKKGRSLPPEYIFQEEKILVQRTRRGMKRKLVCCYDKEGFYNLNRLSNIVLTNKRYKLLFIYAILGSKLMDYYFNKYFNEYEVKPLHLSKLPIKEVSENTQKEFVEQTKKILQINEKTQEFITIFLDRVRDNLGLEKSSKKLKRFYEHNYSTFLSELKKNKIKLDLNSQDEWEKYFNKYKEDIENLCNESSKIDNEIDNMVFSLYGLEDNEINIINNFYQN